MNTTKSSRARAAIKESKLCQFPFADGRRCRMLRHTAHPCLCLFHARAESQFIETERLGTDLAQTISGDFMTATDINPPWAASTPPSRRIVSLSAAPTHSRASAASCSIPSPASNPNSPSVTNSKSGTKCWTPPSHCPPHHSHIHDPHIRRSHTAQTRPSACPALGGERSEDRCLSERFSRRDRRPSERFARGESPFVFGLRSTLSTHGFAIRPGAINLGNTK